jgi:twitching motility protein PilT
MKGRLIELKTKPLEPADTVALMKQISPERTEIEVQEKGGSDFAISWGETRFRVAVFKQKGTIALVMRRIPSDLLTFEQIGLPQIVRELVRRPRGLFLVTGPTGSGKTTTLASMINFTRTNLERHIITIEDPIEYTFPHSNLSVINQREVHVDVPSFSEAIRRALRQDPDTIMVGEMRDLETIESAVSAAETGHLVYGTLHTNSAAGTINRLVDAFPTTQQEQIRAQLSTSLIAVLSQQLMPKIAGGVVAAYEFMIVTPAIANLIRENKTFRIDSMIQTGGKFGMRLLDDHIWELYEKGIVSAEHAIDRSRDPDRLADKIHRAGGKVGRPEIDDAPPDHAKPATQPDKK